MSLRTSLLPCLLLSLGCGGADLAPLPLDGARAPSDGGDAAGDEGGADEGEADEGGPACDGFACLDGVCDEATGACVGCLSDDDCAEDAPTCAEGTCVACAEGDASCGEPPPPAPEPDTEPDTTPPPPPEPDDEPAAPEPRPEPREGERPFRIRFATYNVRTSNLDNAAWRDFHEGWDAKDRERMERVADEILDQELTVVAAQEMRGVERDAVLARLRARGQSWGHTSTNQPALDDTAVLFLRSEWRKVRETYFLIPMQGDLRDRYQVGVLLEHRRTGRAVWFYSVHFAAGGDSGANERAEAARRTVRSLRERAVEGGRPFVLGGDFNAAASGPVGDIFRASGFMKYTRNAADRKVNDGCKSFNGNAGWEGHQQCPGGAASHIDHVWVSDRGMRVETYRVTATARTSRASDHNPLTTVLFRP